MARLHEIAQAHFERGDFTGLFETLYAESKDAPQTIPWARYQPHRHLVEWMAQADRSQAGPRTLVIGCGLGDDAEYLSAQGFDVTAFDIASTAIELCQARFPNSSVNYRVDNLLDPSGSIREQFDFVVEIHTVQAINPSLRRTAFAGLVKTLAPGGMLLVIARGREENEPRGNMPWPLSRADIAELETLGLRETSFENFLDDEDPPTRRFRATYRKP